MSDPPAVELLRRQYLQLIDPERLKLPPPEVLRSPDVQKQIYESMFDDAAINFGPSLRYRLRALKRLIRAIEDSIQDPEEDVGISSCACFSIALPKKTDQPGYSNADKVRLKIWSSLMLFCLHVGNLR